MTGNIVALVPAAGLGQRFGVDRNKPFAELKGKPVLVWVLEALQTMPEVREIIPILKEGDMEYCAEIINEYGISKVRRISPGGRERQDSVFNGLKLIEDRSSIILVHDGVRPFIKASAVRMALDKLNGSDGVVIGVPVKDTIKEIHEGTVRKTLLRETLFAAQTPQIFRFEILYQAYLKASEEGFYSTDDSALVERYGGRVKVSPGTVENIKITTPDDLVFAEALIDQGRV